MPYATRADLEARYGAAEIFQLADRDGDGVIDAGVIEQALTDAGAEVDGYLASRYALPLADVPPIVKVFACDIARYRLWDKAASDEVRRRYEDALRYLRLAADGRVRIAGGGSAEPVASGGAELVSGGLVFARDQGGFL